MPYSWRHGACTKKEKPVTALKDNILGCRGVRARYETTECTSTPEDMLQDHIEANISDQLGGCSPCAVLRHPMIKQPICKCKF